MAKTFVNGPVALNYVKNPYNFNCGGFALGSLDWYIPRGYRECEIDESLELGAKIVQKDFPELMRISHYSIAPLDHDVVGFRLDIREDAEEYYDTDLNEWVSDDEYRRYIEDFHFILRTNGQWFHKPGSGDIEEIYFDPEEEWPHGSGEYNTKTIWFHREHLPVYDIEDLLDL